MAHWQDDEAAFKARFNIAYDDFCRLVAAMTPEDQERYDRICDASKRAAILWALDQGRAKGLISDHTGKKPASGALSPFVEAAHNALAASEAQEEE